MNQRQLSVRQVSRSVLVNTARHRSLMRAFRALAAMSTLMLGAGCSSATDPKPVLSIAGSYQATVFRMMPSGSNEQDVLALGGSLTMTIDSTNKVSGVLVYPAALGGSEQTIDMAGTAVRNASIVQFDQAADSPVRKLQFAIGDDVLYATNRSLGTGVYTIVLARQ